MSVTSMKVQFGYTDDSSVAQTFEVSHPMFGYTTEIILPFTFQQQQDNTWTAWDNGSTYDTRKCKVAFILNATEHGYLMDALKTDTKARNRNVTVTFNTGSGVFLFGADKGDVGPFTCAVEIASEYGIGSTPWKYFRTELILTNVAAWPVYSAPAHADEGPVSIGATTGLRFPSEWFNPEIKQSNIVQITGNNTPYYNNPGSSGDGYVTNATFKCSAVKIADLIENLADTIRIAAFNLVAPTSSYPFGLTRGTGGTYSCKIIQDTFTITHESYNNFTIGLTMAYVSGPA